MIETRNTSGNLAFRIDGGEWTPITNAQIDELIAAERAFNACEPKDGCDKDQRDEAWRLDSHGARVP